MAKNTTETNIQDKKIITVADLPENAGIAHFLKTGIIKKPTQK